MIKAFSLVLDLLKAVAEPEICHWGQKKKEKKEMIKIFPYLYYGIHHSC